MTTKPLPGPQGHWLVGCMPRFARDPLALYAEASREFGHHVRIRAFPGIYVHLLTHPDAVEHVLVKNHKNYRKPDFFNGPVALLAGTGILVSEGEVWRRQRRLMQPAFGRQQIARLGPVIVGAAEAYAPTLPVGREFDILPEMMRLTLRVAGLTLLGADVSGDADELGEAFRVGFEHV
ncbi:MAG: cytochrome P450, partial [Gemmataceae bacterium]